MGLQFHEVDLTRRKVHKLLAHADVVFHMDGYADEHGLEPENRRLLSAQIGHDLVGTARLTETCAITKPRRLILASSGDVYGAARGRPAEERDCRAPVTASGLIATAREHLAQVYDRVTGSQSISLRYFLVYGPRQDPDMAFARLIESALTGRRARGRFQDSYDATYVDDAVAATLMAIDRGPAAAYNIGSGSPTPMADVSELINEIVGRWPDFNEAQLDSTAVVQASVSGARHRLGLANTTRLVDGLRAQVLVQVEHR
jgi:nucleoside-diphosphate-sugar epimerase